MSMYIRNRLLIKLTDHLITLHAISRRNYFSIEKNTHPPFVNERGVLRFQLWISYRGKSYNFENERDPDTPTQCTKVITSRNNIR